MGKVTFEFDEIEDSQDIKQITNRYKLCGILNDVSNYRRELYKYETRGEIPVNEIIDKLDDILNEWYHLSDDLWG